MKCVCVKRNWLNFVFALQLTTTSNSPQTAKACVPPVQTDKPRSTTTEASPHARRRTRCQDRSWLHPAWTFAGCCCLPLPRLLLLVSPVDLANHCWPWFGYGYACMGINMGMHRDQHVCAWTLGVLFRARVCIEISMFVHGHYSGCSLCMGVHGHWTLLYSGGAPAGSVLKCVWFIWEGVDENCKRRAASRRQAIAHPEFA